MGGDSDFLFGSALGQSQWGTLVKCSRTTAKMACAQWIVCVRSRHACIYACLHIYMYYVYIYLPVCVCVCVCVCVPGTTSALNLHLTLWIICFLKKFDRQELMVYMYTTHTQYFQYHKNFLLYNNNYTNKYFCSTPILEAVIRSNVGELKSVLR
jgi:hypothetical protein